MNEYAASTAVRSRRILRWAVPIICVALGVGLILRPGLAAEEPEPDVTIDVTSATPMMVSSKLSSTNIPFSVTCVLPEASGTCDVVTKLHFRSLGGDWASVTDVLSGLQVAFGVPIPDQGQIDYYLEVTERKTGTTEYFPAGGQSSPLSLFVVPPRTAKQLDPLPFGPGRPADSSIRIPWGAAPGQAGMVPGNESSALGPQALDVDRFGNVHLLDQFNGRIQVFDPNGLLIDSIPVDVGPLGDIGLVSDGSYYILDLIPNGVGSHPVVHHVVPSGVPFNVPTSVTTEQTLEEEPALLRVVDDVAWVWGTPSDAWAPVLGDVSEAARRRVTMAQPSDSGYLLTMIDNYRRLDIVPLSAADQTRITVEPPPDRDFGELAVLEPDGDGGYWVVVRTWQEEPANDHHEAVHVSNTGDVIEHFALPNSAVAETAPLSQFRIGDDGDLYQIWTDAAGLEVRRFDI